MTQQTPTAPPAQTAPAAQDSGTPAKAPRRRVITPFVSEIDFGHKQLLLRSNLLSGRIDLRAVYVAAILLALAVVVSTFALGTGDFPVPPGRVLAAYFYDTPFAREIGDLNLPIISDWITSPSRAEALVVREWRTPRVLLAAVFGAALGVSGAIFQSLTRNPLGSPDIIGFNTGAYTGALFVLLVVKSGMTVSQNFFGLSINFTMTSSYYSVAAGAMIGGVITALLVYVLAFKRGVQGFRLIIVGIGISAVLASTNHWLILKASLEDAMSAAVWGAGSLNGMGWSQATPAILVLVIMVPLVIYGSGKLKILEMGDDAAKALGLRAEPHRVFLLVLGVSLTALVTAAAGLISFVALAAPQLARRLTRTAGVSVGASAAMGALLLAISDFLAQRVHLLLQGASALVITFVLYLLVRLVLVTVSGRADAEALPPRATPYVWTGVAVAAYIVVGLIHGGFNNTPLPVGVVTVSIGGIYLVWLLAREAKRQ